MQRSWPTTLLSFHVVVDRYLQMQIRSSRSGEVSVCVRVGSSRWKPQPLATVSSSTGLNHALLRDFDQRMGPSRLVLGHVRFLSRQDRRWRPRNSDRTLRAVSQSTFGKNSLTPESLGNGNSGLLGKLKLTLIVPCLISCKWKLGWGQPYQSKSLRSSYSDNNKR